MHLLPRIREAKERQYQEKRTLVARITDRLGTPIDGGILETVVFLNLVSIPTLQSCEGHVEDGVGAPWVDVGNPTAPPLDEADALFQQARQHKAQMGFTSEVLELFEQAHHAERAAKQPHLIIRLRLMRFLAGFYHPERAVPFEQRLVIQPHADGTSRLMSQGVVLQEMMSPEERAVWLHLYQQEMQEFTAFLKHSYFSFVP